MSLMKRIKLKRKVVKAVDDYLRQLVDAKDITGVRIDLNNEDLTFEEVKSDRSVKFKTPQRNLYDICADLNDESDVQEKIDEYISKLYYDEYIEQRNQK